MPPVAFQEPVEPVGERERALDALVRDRFGNNITEFARKVAAKRGNKMGSEKSAYYRILRGDDGRLVRDRLKTYAEVLKVSPKPFLQTWAEDATRAAADSSSLPPRLSPKEVRALFLELIGRIDRLVDQVEDLERRVPPKRQQEAKP